jgi:hypothetical protein
VAPEPVEAVVTVDTSAVAVDSALVEEPEEVAIIEPEPVVDLQSLPENSCWKFFRNRK